MTLRGYIVALTTIVESIHSIKNTMTNGETFTECDVISREGTPYVFAVTVTYDTDSGNIVSTDFEPVMDIE
jgi:hypothetical protein